MKIIDYKPIDVVNGTGTRASIWMSGCDHKCVGCFSKHTWQYNGTPITPNQLLELVKPAMSDERIIRDGLSILGGDPLYTRNRVGLAEFVKLFKSSFPNKTIWLWTGYTYKECLEQDSIRAIIDHIDVLIDGKFVESNKTDKPFIGSSNQNIIRITNVS